MPVRGASVLGPWPVQDLQDGLPGQPSGVTVKEGGGGVEGVVRTHPDDIQHETIGFARIRAGAPTEHLLVQRRTLGGPRHNNAVHRGLVKAFREDRTVGDHARLPRVQALEDGAAGGERRGAIQRFGGDTGRPKGFRHGIRQGHRWGKEEGFAVRRMGLKGGEDLRRGIGCEEQALQLGVDKIPCWVRRASKSAWSKTWKARRSTR